VYILKNGKNAVQIFGSVPHQISAKCVEGVWDVWKNPFMALCKRLYYETLWLKIVVTQQCLMEVFHIIFLQYLKM
jgi:hypothetical protein